MQSLVLPPSSFITTDFGQPRFSSGPDRLPLSLTRATNARRCTPRDLPLPRSMSGSVSAEDPLETSGNARRPGPPELARPVTTVETSVSTTSTITPTGVAGAIVATGSPVTSTSYVPISHHIASTPGEELSRQPVVTSDVYPTRFPSSLVGPPPSQSQATAYPQPSFGGSPPGTSARVLPQKGTRRTKAHVASACVNCKKKHLGCDPARPCRRCVLSGKEATCVDVTHKKRGRPPLKAEEASLRAYATQMDPRGGPGDQHGAQLRRPMHRATSSRELRPMTDLQMPGGPVAAMGLRAAAPQPHRWPAPTYSPVIDPSLSMQRSIGHRRFSSSGSVQSMTAASPPTYVPLPGGYNPPLGAGRMPTGVGRPLSSYGNQTVQPGTSPPQYPQPFGVPISPYTDSTRMVNRLSMGEPTVRDPRENYVESPVRLPPIYPPTMATPVSSPHGHRLSDPYPGIWSPRTREQYLQQEQRQHVLPQNLMPPISPGSQMRHAATEFTFGEQTSRPLASLAESTPRHLSITSMPGREDPVHDLDAGDSRPAKRRKMALDDMVND